MMDLLLIVLLNPTRREFSFVRILRRVTAVCRWLGHSQSSKLDKAERTNKKSNKKTVRCWKEKEGRDDEGGDKGRERRKTGGRGREQEMASTRGNKVRRGAVLIRWDEVAVCVCMRDE